MTKNNSYKLNLEQRVTRNEANIAAFKESLNRIENQVMNHIPTILQEINVKIDLQERRMDKLENKIAYYAGGLAVLVAVLQYLFKFIR